MLDIIYKLNTLLNKDSIFWFCALAGSGMFVIQFILSMFGADGDTDVDDGNSISDSGNFRWLSKQAVTGFLMMFGWVGLTCQKEFGFSGVLTTLVAFLGGLVSIFFTGLIFSMAKKLRSPGTVFNIEDAIGKTATTYQRVPKDGVGKVSVLLNNFTYELDAISLNQEVIDSFTAVQIIKKADEKTVVIVPIK